MAKSKWMICPECNGDGSHAKHLGVINPDEWEFEELERYMEGGYDKVCELCNGDGKLLRAELKKKREAKAARLPWWHNDPEALAEMRMGA